MKTRGVKIYELRVATPLPEGGILRIARMPAGTRIVAQGPGYVWFVAPEGQEADFELAVTADAGVVPPIVDREEE